MPAVHGCPDGAAPAPTGGRPDAVPLLTMRAIGKAFAGVRVLEGVDFALRAGEVHVLAGENGAGKSTLINILGGVHAPAAGTMRVGGQPYAPRNPQAATAAGIAVIHQELALAPAMTVLDNLFLGREQLRHGLVDRRCQRRVAQAALAGLGIELPLDRAVEQLPLASQQVVEIAKALLADAQILVMDEPTSALTAPEAAQLFQTIARLRARGVGIIYISHKMDEIYRIADRITVLRDGRRVGTAAAAELPAAQLVNWMVGRPLGEQYARTPHQPGAVLLQLAAFSMPDPVRPHSPLVDRVSLELRAGEILGLAGLEGSGNRALLHGIFGAHTDPVTGRIRVGDRDLGRPRPARAIAHGIALVPADRKNAGLVAGMSVRGNLTLAAFACYAPYGWVRHGREQAAARQRAQALNIRLADMDQPVATLSGGNQQKVVLGKWLETAPRILLLDDPTRGIDIGAKHEIYQRMDAWAAAGGAIMLVSSEMPELLAMADRILVFHQGRVVAAFAAADTSQEQILRAAMGKVDNG
jgi:ABC-type sugar transport system ATPase subunit